MPRKITYKNLITEAYAKCGGLDAAAELMEVSRATAFRWRKDGKIQTVKATKLLAGKTGWPIDWFYVRSVTEEIKAGE